MTDNTPPEATIPPQAGAEPASRPGKGIKTTIQVLERMVSLLDALAQQPRAVSLKELSSRTALHPSTAHRILNDLVTARFVDRVDTGSYQLGLRLLELGNLVKARLSVRDAAMGPMRELHRLTGQPINLSIRQGDEIVYIERALSERSGMQVVRAVGGRAPLHLTSVGKLFLAGENHRALQNYISRTGLAQVRSHGFARDNEELELGVRCIAAGIRDDSGDLVAGLSISAPADFLQNGWVEQLCRTAAQISASLGYDANESNSAH